MGSLIERYRLLAQLFRERCPIAIQPSLLWRRLLRLPLLREAVLDRWVDHAAWEWRYSPGGGGLYNIFQIHIRRGVIRQYIRNYHRQHGRLPTNTHRVVMSYAPDGSGEYLVTIRVGTGVLQQRGTIDMEVTFPPGPLPPQPVPEPLRSRYERSCLHSGPSCPFCNADPTLIFLESTDVRGVWGENAHAPRTAYLFTRRRIADWFGATHDEQVALTKSIDIVRDALEERLRRHGRLLPLGYSVRFDTGKLLGCQHLHVEVRPRYVGRWGWSRRLG